MNFASDVLLTENELAAVERKTFGIAQRIIFHQASLALLIFGLCGPIIFQFWRTGFETIVPASQLQVGLPCLLGAFYAVYLLAKWLRGKPMFISQVSNLRDGYRVEIDRVSVRLNSKRDVIEVPLAAIVRIEETPKLLFIWWRGGPMVLPKRIIGTFEQLRELKSHLMSSAKQ